MENTSEINERIAKNLAYYRKAAGFTQAELAEKINYSDKSVSKWEQGNGVPDVYILLQLAKLYNVTVDDLVGDGSPTPMKRNRRGLHLLIMLLSSGIVWLVATCIFVGLLLWLPSVAAWMVFLYAVCANAILLIVYAGIWKYRFLGFVSVSALVWVALTCLYVTVTLICEAKGVDTGAFWCVFLVGIPLQVLEVLWVFFRSLFKKNKTKKQAVEEKE